MPTSDVQSERSTTPICDGEFAGPAACVCGHPERHMTGFDRVWCQGCGSPDHSTGRCPVAAAHAGLTIRETMTTDDNESSPATARAAATTTTGVDMTEKDAAYEAERAQWIERNGSRRLTLAAERGYMHDGIYRDERLAAELPDFRYIVRPKVKEIVNPTEDALDVEDDVIGRGFVDARLVYISDSDDGTVGEAVQVKDVFRKFTVYRLVEEDA